MSVHCPTIVRSNDIAYWSPWRFRILWLLFWVRMTFRRRTAAYGLDQGVAHEGVKGSTRHTSMLGHSPAHSHATKMSCTAVLSSTWQSAVPDWQNWIIGKRRYFVKKKIVNGTGEWATSPCPTYKGQNKYKVNHREGLLPKNLSELLTEHVNHAILGWFRPQQTSCNGDPL